MRTFFHRKRNILVLKCFATIFFFFWPKLVFKPSQTDKHLQSFKRCPSYLSRKALLHPVFHLCYLRQGKRRASRGAALDTGTTSYPTSAPSRLGWWMGHKTGGRWIKASLPIPLRQSSHCSPMAEGWVTKYWLSPKCPVEAQYLIQEKENMACVSSLLAATQFLCTRKILKTCSSCKKEVDILFLDTNVYLHLTDFTWIYESVVVAVMLGAVFGPRFCRAPHWFQQGFTGA